MSDLRSAVNRSHLLDILYGAAETLIEAVTDPEVIAAAPLHHRARALDAVGRFMHRLEKREAAAQPAPLKEEESWDPDAPVAYIDFVPAECIIRDEDVDHYVALELEYPGRFGYKRVDERLKELRRNDPAALQHLDPDLARAYFATSHVSQFESLCTLPPFVAEAKGLPVSYDRPSPGSRPWDKAVSDVT